MTANELIDQNARIAEERRQGEIFYRAIVAAIDEVAASTTAPIINAAFGALVAVEADMIASVDERGRSALIAAIEEARPDALARALSRASAAKKIKVAMVEK